MKVDTVLAILATSILLAAGCTKQPDACDRSWPPALGDVQEGPPVPALCTTDTDCMRRFGGDGSPTRF